MKRTAALCALMLLPSMAFAAGFAKQSIFLSKTSVTEGETVLIHAVVQNDLTAKFPGQLVIKDGEAKVGSVPVTLAAGEARAVSVSWTPEPGTHTITAQLQDQSGTVIESESEDFTVAEKPKPKPAVSKVAASLNEAAAVESSAGIQKQIGSLSPAAEGAVAPIFKLVDGSRRSMADVLDGQLASVKPKLSPVPMPGVVAGAQTVKTPEQSSWFWSIFYTVYFYILTILRYIVGSAAVFYPVFVALVCIVLWKTYKRFRRS